MKRLLMIAAISLVAACGNSETPAPVSSPEATPAPVTPQPVNLSTEEKHRVCRAAIAEIMGRSAQGIAIIADDGRTIRTRYTRDDGKVWTNECRVGPTKVEWRMIEATYEGRWRDEDTITYSINGDTVHVRQDMNGEFVSEGDHEVPN